MKKPYMLGAVLCILITVSLCIQEDTEEKLTEETVGQKVSEAYEDVETYRMSMVMEMEMTTEVEGEETAMNIEMSMDGVYDEKNKKGMSDYEMALEIGEGGMSYTLGGEMYIIGNTLYMKMLGQWQKQEMEDLSTMDQTEAFEELLTASEILEMKEETLNGEDVYYLKLRPSLSQLAEAFTKTQGAYGNITEGIGLEEFEEAVEDFEVEYWISGEEYRIVKIAMVMDLIIKDTLGMGGEAEGSMAMTVNLSEYNEPVTIELPEEAESAEEMTGSTFP